MGDGDYVKTIQHNMGEGGLESKFETDMSIYKSDNNMEWTENNARENVKNRRL